MLSHICRFVCAVPFAWSSFLACCPWPVLSWSPLDVTSFGKLFFISPPPVWVTGQARVLVITRISFSADFHSLIFEIACFLVSAPLIVKPPGSRDAFASHLLVCPQWVPDDEWDGRMDSWSLDWAMDTCSNLSYSRQPGWNLFSFVGSWFFFATPLR